MSLLRMLVCVFVACTLALTITPISTSAAGAADVSLPSVNVGSFVQTEILRTIDLRTHIEEVTLQITAKNTGSSSNSFIVSVPASKSPRLAFFEGSIGKQKLISRQVRLNKQAATVTGSFYQIDLPQAVAQGDSIQLQVFLVFTRTQKPFPEYIEQPENQLVLWEDSTYVYSPYTTESQETIVRLASRQIESYTKKNSKKVGGDELRYGPFEAVTPYESQPLSIHFVNNSPFVTFNTLSKDIEVSHWGNVAIQDNYVLTHTGAKLKGAFHRFDYERSRGGESAPASFRTLVGELPRTAKDIYYRDVIGNVSTSHIRKARDHTRVEIDPRFPMFGGWESDFHIGYNLPSQHYLSVDNNDSGNYILNISFAAPFSSAAIDDLEVRVILPEGANSIEWRTPFDIDSAEFTEFKTYLDTTGRPTLILRKKNCVRYHQQHFQVSYRFAKASILREPLLIAAATLLCLLLVIAFTQADLRITDDESTDSVIGSSTVVRASSLSTRRTGTELGESIQTVLENLLAEPNGLLAVAQHRQQEKQSLVNALVKDITNTLNNLATEDSATFSSIVTTLNLALLNLQKASKRYVVTATGAEVKAAREALASIVESVREQAGKLANL